MPSRRWTSAPRAGVLWFWLTASCQARTGDLLAALRGARIRRAPDSLLGVGDPGVGRASGGLRGRGRAGEASLAAAARGGCAGGIGRGDLELTGRLTGLRVPWRAEALLDGPHLPGYSPGAKPLGLGGTRCLFARRCHAIASPSFCCPVPTRESVAGGVGWGDNFPVDATMHAAHLHFHLIALSGDEMVHLKPGWTNSIRVLVGLKEEMDKWSTMAAATSCTAGRSTLAMRSMFRWPSRERIAQSLTILTPNGRSG